MTFSVVRDDVGEAAWNAYVDRTAGASLYHLYQWRGVIERTFGHQATYLAARSDDDHRIIGILPLVQLKSRLFGRMVVSLPFFNYGGICADRDDVRRALLDKAIEVTRAERADFLELRQETQWPGDLPCKTSKAAMRLELPAAAEDLWKALGSKLRNQVQKPRKEGATVKHGGIDLLGDFYRVFSANMRDLGTPVYSRGFFADILKRFEGRTWITCVYMNGIAVAAGFLAGYRHQVEIPWASSLKSHNRFGPNMLLYWSCLEAAIARGYTTFDFGRSTVGEGTYRFKAQWGAQPRQLYWYYWLRNGREIPQVNPANPKYRSAIAVWRRLPLAVTRWVGPHVVKYIP